jgi:drug/metabolite transporter (DMT)-like permease
MPFSMSGNKKSLFFVTGSMFVFGTIGVFVKTSGQSVFNIVFFRCLVAAICLGTYIAFTSQIKANHFKPRVILPLMASGAALAFNWVFLFKSFELTSITTGIIFYYTQPFILIFFGFLFFKETIKKHHLFWTMIAFTGLILCTGVLNDDIVTGNITQGVMFAVCAAALYATVVIAAKWYQTIPPAVIVFIQTSVGAVVLFPFTNLSDVPLTGHHWYFLISLGAVHTALSYIFFFKGVQTLKTPVIAILGFIEPVVAILSDIIVYDQHIGYIRSLGIALILLGGICRENSITALK